jgi:hypothetical protein
LLAAARGAFIEAMDRTMLIAVVFAILGAVVALLFLPAQQADAEPREESPATEAAPAAELTGL